MAAANPYLGTETFELRHRDLFFGRSAEGRVVASMIASEPVTILTGASGTGKSSLLRAQILPTLATRGWCAIYAHPQGNPVEALREEMIAQTLPDPDFERATIATLLAKGTGLTSHSTLIAAQQWFAGLEQNDPHRKALIASRGEGKIPHYSRLSQMLAGILTPAQVEAQIGVLTTFAGTPRAEAGWTFDGLLAQLDYASRGRVTTEQLLRGGDGTLVDLIERISIGWIEPLDLLGVVLVLDQAEELYTSFGATSNTGVTALHDWRLREALFEEARRFAALSARRPVQLCFSLRPEWYAMLRVSLEHSIADEKRCSYFLSRFDAEHAEEAIVEPARIYGGNVETDAVEYALAELGKATDKGEIDPFLLAITFYRAWLVAARRSGPLRIIATDLSGIADQEKVDGATSLVGGSIKLLLDSGLENLDHGEEFDGIILLASLFNEDRTRRIVPEDELISRPLRDRERLRRLLDQLDDAGLIRRFRRGDLILVEVRHERLALPVFERMETLRKNEDEDAGTQKRGRFRSLLGRALTHLMTYNGAILDSYIASGLDEDPLPAWASLALKSNYQDIFWDQAAARTLLASLLHSGPDQIRIEEARDGAKAKRTDGLNWDEWRKLVAFLLPIASRSLPVDPAAFREDPAVRDEIEAALLRGAHLLPENAQDCLRMNLREVTPDTRLALMRSVLSATDRYRNSLEHEQ